MSSSFPTLIAKRKRSDSETADPPSKFSKEASNLGSLWSGSSATLVIFGDSYSASPGRDGGDDEMTWATQVDHLQARPDLENASIRNFSFPGATAEDDLETQTFQFFVQHPPKKAPASDGPLDPMNTYCVFFLGINDCGRTDDDELEAIVETILDATHTLYIKAGARRFIFIDVPPIDRSPGALEFEDTIRTRVNSWNEQLHAQVSEFTRETPQATVFFFSAHTTITEILENPAEYDFLEDDIADEGGAIWTDYLHITTAVHKIMATHLLASVPSEG
ncbi:hypothetical protein BDN72DRAFT_860747 [Pluteus cervinus]|uniref:Uncharacterized protein n=1 Tax=Pluteus cervinus TaxID=181527 RepID=A0ACD3AHV6_9AGAR|nr:hypothetical protein BDN72DRAFT_860747 [Pluteus cervinus]